MDVECCPKAEEEDVISKDPLPIGPEGENIALPTPDSTTPELPETFSRTESGTSNQDEEQKESKIKTLKRLVVGKTKLKSEEDKNDSTNKNEDKSHTSRALRKSLSRVFSVSSSSLGRVWSSFSATRIHSEGESGTSTKSFGKMFGKKNKQENDNELGGDNLESKTNTLGRRLSSTLRSAFGRSKET
ncbi:unnamed protein product [Nezara viridula]|uniref:Uncharacterized protein n=1 Tax=Nezara viridula TaxID=85310 RepID=A0A9P0HAT1_NEZVI|nr:unnamed protein product [Nezara viridula]